MNNIGQFNLIGGDNNVGKTTLLEALLLDENDVSHTIFGLAGALAERKLMTNPGGLLNWVLGLYQSQKAETDAQIFLTKLKDDVLHKYSLRARYLDSLTDKESKSIEVSLMLNQNRKDILEISSDGKVSLEFPIQKDTYFPFVGVNIGYGDDLVDMYSSQIQNSVAEEKELIADLRSFIPDVKGLGISNTLTPDKQNVIIVRLEGQDKPLPLPMFGEGAVKMFRILVEIAMCKGRRLMIDEIDTGIHHSRFKLFWKTILKAAKKKDVQIFATTHNHECLRFLKETLELEEDDMKSMQNDTRYFLLHQQKDKSVVAANYNFSQFQFAIDQNNEIRS
jgi:hypothetical protein